jgi:molybdopterin synthase sulfur carrier subunit
LNRRRLRRIEIASPVVSAAPADKQSAPCDDEKPGGKTMATARVVLSSGFSRRYTGGAREFDIEATTMRDVLKELERRYPGIHDHLVEETTVAIDGEIHDEPAYFQKVRDGCEIFFIPKLEGG